MKSAKFPFPVTTILPDRLYAIGGYISCERPLSWLSPHAHGFLPVQCYAFRDGAELFVIDTGLHIHQAQILRGLTAIAGDASMRRLVLTRREPDNMMNLTAIVQELGIHSVQCSGPADPFDIVDKVDTALSSAQIKAMLGTAASFFVPGEKIAVGTLEVEHVRPGLRMLATEWFYEKETRSLFTTDTWAFVTRPSPDLPAVLRPSPDDISVKNIRNHLAAKFEWLSGTDTKPIADALRAVLQRPTDRICPFYGCTIEGADNVQRLLDNTMLALEALAAEPPLAPMKGFEWPRDRRLIEV